MKLFITGGAGFIGSHFVKMAVRGNFGKFEEILVYDALTYAGKKSNLEEVIKDRKLKFYKGDINDYKYVVKLIKGTDLVINFAAESHVDRSIQSSSEFINTNILGVHNLLKAVLDSGVNKFIQISTDEVYGSVSEGKANEKSPLMPNSPYSASKASADLIVRSYIKTHGLDAIITRSSNNYGPFQDNEKLIPRAISKLFNNEKIPVFGDGLNIRNWIHVEDNCRAIFKIIESGKSGEIYNIGGDTEISNIDLVRRISILMGKGDDTVEFVKDRQGHDFRYAVDDSKLKTDTNFNCNIDFISGIQETIEWYTSNPKYINT
jgi:dTDP-glucose 4,6-dehydratase